MFVTDGQFDVFCLCFSFGVVWGVVVVLFAPFGDKYLSRLTRALFQTLYFALAGIGFFFLRSETAFPSARLYMLVGFLFGIGIVYKSFYQTVANFYRKVYNRRKGKKAAKKI